MEKSMTGNDRDWPWLYRKGRLLFELLVFLACWLALDAALRLHRLGQPTVPRIFQALLMGLAAPLGTQIVRWKTEQRTQSDRWQGDR
jgi:hypothetical protein